MTWRVCSPPWPGRQNPGSWPGRLRCGLPSAGLPLRPVSHPLRGGPCGTDGPGGLGHLPVPEPGWPRRWSRQWPGWAASWRPTRTCCPAPFSSGPTSPWRRRPRVTAARYRPLPRRARGTPRPARSSRPAGRAPEPAVRQAPVSPPAGRTPPGRTFRRHSRRRLVTAPPGRPAALARGTRRFRRRRPRPGPARRRPGPRRSTARAASAGPRASPPCPRPLPDLRSPDRRGAHLERAHAPRPVKAQIVTTEA